VWTHNGTDVKQRNDITYSPPILNHSLMISNARIGDSGVYICHAVETPVKQTITVEVIAGSTVVLRRFIAYYNIMMRISSSFLSFALLLKHKC